METKKLSKEDQEHIKYDEFDEETSERVYSTIIDIFNEQQLSGNVMMRVGIGLLITGAFHELTTEGRKKLGRDLMKDLSREDID